MGAIRIICTALPGRLNATAARPTLSLSAFLSHRLSFPLGTETGTLASFPALLAWPEALMATRVRFEVVVDGQEGRPIPATVVTSPPPDPRLWAQVFEASTLVRGQAPGLQREPFNTYSPIDLQRDLARGTNEIGEATPYRLPDAATLKRAFSSVIAAVSPSEDDGLPGSVDHLQGMAEPELGAMHRALGRSLLSLGGQHAFDQRLALLTALAGLRARHGPSPGLIPVVPPDPDAPATLYAQFAAFHRRAAPRRDATPAAPEPRDFHQIASALAEHPSLMRRLGLVIDLEIAAADLPLSPTAAPRRLRLKPHFADAALSAAVFALWTVYLLDPQSGTGLPRFSAFSAAPRPRTDHARLAWSGEHEEIVAGLLNLGARTATGERAFELVTLDIDGAISKLVQAISTVVTDEGRPTHPIDRTVETGVPAFRSCGLSLVRREHAEQVLADVRRAEAQERAFAAGTPFDLHAEELVRGYRIDVRHTPARPAVASSDDRTEGTTGAALPEPQWRSLHARVGTYQFGGGTSPDIVSHADEGCISPALMQDVAAQHGATGETHPYFVPENVSTWSGWSLAAPPPPPPVGAVVPVEMPFEMEALGLPRVDVSFTAQSGSLPRLRFGDAYRMRVRTVDLAGNSLSLDEADDVLDALSAAGAPLPVAAPKGGDDRYRRFEPLPAPEIVMREGPSDGETIDVMVIRSNGATPAQYAASFADRRYRAESERHILPPRTTRALAELHGCLDRAFGAGGDPEGTYGLLQREAASLHDPFVIDAATGHKVPFPDRTVTYPNGTSQTVRHGLEFVGFPAPDSKSGYSIHYEPQLKVPYLPDPFARGAAVFGLPGVSNTTGELDAEGELRFSTPEGQVLALRATRDLGFVTKISFGASDRWPDLAPFRLRLEGLSSTETPVRPRWSRDRRELVVRLAPGEQKTVWISSYPAPADVDVFALHRWWTEAVAPSADSKHFLRMAAHGALGMISPPRRLTLVHAVQRPVHPPKELSSQPLGVVKFRGGTTAFIGGAFIVHAASTAKLDLEAKWDEQGEGPEFADRQPRHTHVLDVAVPPPRAAGPEKPIATFDERQGVLAFVAPSGSILPAERYPARHEFADTKYRNVTYSVVATTRYREYFPQRIADDAAQLTQSYSRTIRVLSSAAPPAPEIGSIVPSFGWIVDRTGTRVRESVRRGGGVRIYLGARWHLTGAGEQLAVIEAQGFARWGSDPVHLTAQSSEPTAIVPDAPSARAEGSPFDRQLHPYPVHYDAELKLWFCDVSFRVGTAYFPFRELTLVRYQRHSLPGLHVSKEVRAGLHQLAPDRAVSLAYPAPAASDPDHRRIDIAVSTRSTLAPASVAAGGSTRSLLEVSLEERPLDREGWDPNLGWSQAAEQPLANAAASPPQLWSGSLRLPRAPVQRQRRLMVKEFELHAAERAPPGQAWLQTPGGPARRLVYSDAIPIE